jgi:hypothetical protein
VKNLFRCLPDYQPFSEQRSEILNKGQMLVLSYHLPAVLRLQNWILLFSLNHDGYSHHTFFDKVGEHEETILVIKDTNGHKFGAYCTGVWHPQRGFVGDSTSWVFSFHKGDDLNLWPGTGDSDMFQHSDNDGLIIGGSPGFSEASAITVMNNFRTGRSGKSSAYDNEILCAYDEDVERPYADFEVVSLEIWGFEV